MKTTIDDVINLYDTLVPLMQKRIDEGTVTAADVTNILRLLDKSAVLALLRAHTVPTASAENPSKTLDVPFPDHDDLDASEFNELRVN